MSTLKRRTFGRKASAENPRRQKRTGFCRLAVLLAAAVALSAGGFAQSIDGPAQSWRYFAANAADNPQPDGDCITNGTEWALAVAVVDAEARTLKIVGRGTTENAYLTDPAAGSTLDLRGTVFGPDDSETWTISAIDENALGADAMRNTASAVVTPGTLVGNVERWFRCATRDTSAHDAYKSRYTSITIDEPNVTGSLREHLTPLTEEALVWSIRVPCATAIEAYAIAEKAGAGFPNASCVFAEDSFLSVRTIAHNGIGKSGRNWQGVLNLPRVETIDVYVANGTDPGWGEIRLGTEAQSVKVLGAGAFNAIPGLTNVVLGLAKDNQIYMDAFRKLPNLRRVEFTGCPPNFDADAEVVFMGSGLETGLSTTFVVPPSAAWAGFLAPFAASDDFVRWSGDEIRAYRAEHPDGPIVVGTVSRNVFRSTQTQYLAVSDRLDAWVGELDWDAAQGTVDVGDFEIDDAAPFGVTRSLTASAKNGFTFAGWYGGVSDGKCTDATLVLRETAELPWGWVFARFTHPWTLTADGDGNAVVLDNGLFRIQAMVDPATRALTLGRGTAGSLYAPDSTGDGVLDLGGAITDAVGVEYRIVSFGVTKSAFSVSDATDAPCAQMLISPGTLDRLEAVQLFHASGHRATWEAVIFDEPTATGGPSRWMFTGQSLLRHVIFRCPSWTFPYSLDGLFYGTSVSGTDVGWWKLDGVKTFGSGTDNNMNKDKKDYGTRAYLQGSLRLPTATAISPCAFQNNLLSEVWLGHGSAKSRVTNIQSNAFDNAGITNLVLNAAPNLKVGENAFANTGRLKTVTFLRYVVSADAFAAILASATAEAPTVVYATKAYGWGQAAYLDAPTEAELSAAPADETVLGVWRGVDGTDGIRAWVCHRDSPFPFKGMQLIVR